MSAWKDIQEPTMRNPLPGQTDRRTLQGSSDGEKFSKITQPFRSISSRGRCSGGSHYPTGRISDTQPISSPRHPYQNRRDDNLRGTPRALSFTRTNWRRGRAELGADECSTSSPSTSVQGCFRCSWTENLGGGNVGSAKAPIGTAVSPGQPRPRMRRLSHIPGRSDKSPGDRCPPRGQACNPAQCDLRLRPARLSGDVLPLRR